MALLPIIKWTGSKRYQAQEIVDNFPKEINTYYEPFLGGGSVLGEYLQRLEGGYYKCNKIICCDINRDLIELWKIIKSNPETLINEYIKLYNLFSSLGSDFILKRKFYYEQRDKYNKLRKDNIYNLERISLFNWLLRNSMNGLVRYNSRDEFNAACNYIRNGIIPKNLEKIINEWSRLLNKYNVEFICGSYEELENITENDLMYFDPPYPGSENGYNLVGFNNIKFFEWLKKVPCKYLLSYDGKSGKDDRTYDVPKEVYNQHLYLDSGVSSFKRTRKIQEQVFDSLYIQEKRGA